ncbi:MAG TPA: ATP-binding protein [Thermoanaerobaculia bacterium]|nr:ATP-binding protein [Thermoanaerobaculia bacterium]
MARRGLFSFSRRLLVASILLALFVLFDISLFGWLIFRSLSQHEIERVLLETREEAQGIARQIEGRAKRSGKDLYTAVALERETQTYIDSVLHQRDLVQTVEIRDKDGRLVFRSHSEATIPVAPPVDDGGRRHELPPQVEKKTVEKQSSYEVSAPIGNLGMIRIGISQGVLEKRIAVLRTELLRQATFIGAVTLALLAFAYFAIAWLWRRGRVVEEQAKEAERLAYIGTLASGLAHEIRNPLNSLNLNMQLLEEEIAHGRAALKGSHSRRLLGITRTEISRLERLVIDFLSYARPRPLELEDIPAVALLERCREVLAGQLREASVEVNIVDRSNGAWVRVDPNQVNQLLLNLVQNAINATEESGRPPRVRLEVYQHAGSTVLEVVDNGVGMTEAERERIFDIFYSTRKGGTGLGLAIVQRIAKAHDAEVEIESVAGVGTTVRLRLPPAGRRGEPLESPASDSTS